MCLQVWVYEDDDGGPDSAAPDSNLYVHHDIMLPAFPLALAWLDCMPSSSSQERGNIVAVGSMDPGIELWALDMVDAVEPLATLGGADPNAPLTVGQKKKGKRKVRTRRTMAQASPRARLTCTTKAFTMAAASQSDVQHLVSHMKPILHGIIGRPLQDYVLFCVRASL